jgi:hypothetical protein
MKACCPDGAKECDRAVVACRPEIECRDCATDDDCPAVPSSLCGSNRCVENKCQLELHADKPAPSQLPGDCKITLCDANGNAEVAKDPADLPLDGNPCTTEVCSGKFPSNTPLPDGTPCPGEGSGICLLGRCVECNETLYPAACPGGLVCDGSFCVPSACKDAVKNGKETFTDCGGPDCRPCSPKLPCLEGRDCISGVCADNVCQKSSPDDGVKNGSETGVDCGYYEAPPNTCADGEGCDSPDDCVSSVCYDGLCLARTCFDATRNGKEMGIDCGGDCPSCPN